MRNLLYLVLFIAFPGLADNSPKKLQDLMDDWLSLESQKGSMQMSWRERKASLERRLELFGEEKLALTKVVESASDITDEVNTRRLNLLSQQEKLEMEQVRVETVLSESIPKLLRIIKRLPPPVQADWQDKLALLSQKNASNSEKLERIFNLLNAAEEFNERVAVHESAIEIQNSGEIRRVQVSQIYLGVAQGWYVSSDGSAYGYGKSTPQGWQWWHNSEASKELGRPLDPQDILELKAMLENPTSANYLSLPVKL